MKILKTLVGSDDSQLRTCDTIEHEGGLWLVPRWNVAPTEGWRKPARIIRMDTLPHQEMSEAWEQDFSLQYPIPKAVLFCQTPPEEAHGFDVIDQPDIMFPGGNKLN